MTTEDQEKPNESTAPDSSQSSTEDAATSGSVPQSEATTKLTATTDRPAAPPKRRKILIGSQLGDDENLKKSKSRPAAVQEEAGPEVAAEADTRKPVANVDSPNDSATKGSSVCLYSSGNPVPPGNGVLREVGI